MASKENQKPDEVFDQVYESEVGFDDQRINLKQGVDMKELLSQQGTCFEVQENASNKGAGPGGDAPPPTMPLDASELLENLNAAPLGGGHGTEDDEGDIRSPFERLSNKMIRLTEDGGVLKRVVKRGVGDDMPDNAKVRVHYSSYVEYQDEPFDSTRLRGPPAQFRLHKKESEVIVGLQVAVQSMKKGEISEFILKPEYAYGKMGSPPRIPADSSLLYNIELLGWSLPTALDEYFSLSKEERRRWPMSRFLKVIEEQKEMAKDKLSEDSRFGYQRAFKLYESCTRFLEEYQLHDDEEERVQRQQLLALYNNCSFCAMKLQEGPRCITFANKALDLDRMNVKALGRKGVGKYLVGDMDAAVKFLKRAQKIEPNNTWINQQLAKIDKVKRRDKFVEKDMCRKMFGNTAPVENKAKSANTAGVAQETVAAQRELLKDLVDSEDREMTLPGECFTEQERNCLIGLANDMGLRTFTVGKSPDITIKILKKES